MDIDDHSDQQQASSSRDSTSQPLLDLVGGSFAVLESDPGVFTTLARKLGINHVELVELYDIEPCAVDDLKPHGLIFCFLWNKDSHRPTDFDDPAAKNVWFANQLSDDACATHAILNVVLNCPAIDIGEQLRWFKNETEHMSPVVRGLAVTNLKSVRCAHNSLARPADIRGSLSYLANITLDAEKVKKKASKPPPKQTSRRGDKPPPQKRTKTKSDKEEDGEVEEEAIYHFIGYVPAFGKVWELDGLKSGPLEVGELPFPISDEGMSSAGQQPASSDPGWMDVVRPALRMKMEKYGGSAENGNNIRFSLLAIVDDLYEKASDNFEFLKRDLRTIERELGDSWKSQVAHSLLQSSRNVFGGSIDEPVATGKTFTKDFGARRILRDAEIMKMSPSELIQAWEACITAGMRAKVFLEDELMKGLQANTDHVKRTFDYEPFLKEFVHRLHQEKLLGVLLDPDDKRKKKAVK